MSDSTLELLALLWGKAIGTEGYQEHEWKELRRLILRERSIPKEAKPKAL